MTTSAFPEQVTDLLCQCRCAARTLAVARELQNRQRLANVAAQFVVDDVVESVIKQLAAVEKQLLDLLTEHGGKIEAGGFSLSARPNDRRSNVRPMFVLHKNTDVPAGRRRQPLAAVS